MSNLKKLSLIFISGLFHLVAAGVIYYFWQPIASWYFNYRPVLGVDFYNLASYVGYLSRHFVWQFNGWKYTWWGGGPLFFDYPTLHAYLVLPLLKWFSLPQAIQVYALSSYFLLLFFSYLLFVEVGKDRVLAAILAIASSFSIGLYGALVWGGSLQYVATQFFLPLVLWFLIKFFGTGDKRWFYLSSLFLGLSFLGHPQVGFSYLIPIAFLFLLFHPIRGEKFFILTRIKRIFTYFLLGLLAGYPAMYTYIGKSPLDILNALPKNLITLLVPRAKSVLPAGGGMEGGTSASGVAEILQFHQDQIRRFFTDIHESFFYFLAFSILVALCTFLLRKKKVSSLKTFVFALPAFWVFFNGALLGFGIGIGQGGWFRVFWPFPLALGIFISFVWGDFWASIKEKLGALVPKLATSFLLPILSGFIIFIPAYILLPQGSVSKMISKIEAPGYRQQSSAFPDSLNVYLQSEEFEKLKTKLIPSWLNPSDTQYRLYDADQRVNIWWNALYDMPLVKGYIELPGGDASTGVFYWTSIALTQSMGEDSLVESWGTPKEMALNNALFLLDWLSIKYLEAEHEKSDSYNPLTSYLTQNEIFANKEKVIVPGWVQLYQIPEGQPLIWHPEEDEHLTYYQVKDELVSPIAHTTNASVLGFVGSEGAYHTLLRDLAAVNLNSRRVIPVRLGEFLDDVSYQSLKDMDAAFLYSYNYNNHNKVWSKIERYVKEGGKVFIETGSDVKQTNSINLKGKYPRGLPAIFPIKMTKQEKLGDNWGELSSDAKETEGINLEAFGPPLLDGQPWLFSLPASPSDLKEGARVILAAGGTPLIVAHEYGEGEVIWSGMNLPYHIATHKNMEEAKLLENLLEDFVDTSPSSYEGFTVKRESPNKVVIQSTNAKGIFFRENSNPGWTANLTSRVKNQNLRIYRAGPTFWGFSYARLPKEVQEPFTVTFSYRGEFWVYFWTFVWLLTILLLLDRILLNSRLLAPILVKIFAPIKARVSKWWEREEEE